MALRLSVSSLTPETRPVTGGDVVTPAPALSLAAQLSAEARVALDAHDLDSYRALFARATGDDDGSLVFHARTRLIEEGLAAAQRTDSSGRAIQIFIAVAKAAIDLLEEEPREPILLNYTAIALYELWSIDAAQELFKAVRRLDPAMPHLDKNLEQLAQRKRELNRAGRGSKPLHASVPALAARARALAPRARPAEGLTLSLCMIVRDEEKMLPRCLAAVAPAVDEIVIVDTGSKDRTIEIAREFGARVIEREWTGSFADARNVSFEAATGDWLIYLDADEVLVAEDVKRLRALTGRTWREAFYLVETSFTGEEDDGAAFVTNTLRVFRNRPHYRFQGRLHEQIAQNLPPYAAARIEQTSVRIDHFGYLGEVRSAKEKSRRNLDLLRAQEAEGEDNSFLHYNLGTEYALLGENEESLREFQRSWSLVQRNGEHAYDFVPALRARVVSALGKCGRLEEAISEAEDALQMLPGFTDLVNAQAVASMLLGREVDAIAYWEKCIQMGEAPSRFGSTLGVGTFLPRIAIARLHLRAGEVEAARELLEWCIARHPEFVGVLTPYAVARLRAGVAPEAVTEEIEQRVPDITPSARYMLGSAFHAYGALEAAERQYRAALADRPQSFHIRTNLAEMLLNQGRYAEAAAEAAQVDDEGPFAALACRIELWGRIASGDLDGARAATPRAARAGVPAAELDVFAAWLEATGATEEPRSLRVAATPLLGVILDSLLGLHAFETFETLAGVLGRSALPARERRELLASMYLKHGFLASAATEWMAVCQSAPDARALVGLAQIAAAQGQPEDAAVFASETLKHDPFNATARQILANCSAPQASDLVAHR